MCVLDKIDFKKLPEEIIEECKVNKEFKRSLGKGVINLIILLIFGVLLCELSYQFLKK